MGDIDKLLTKYVDAINEGTDLDIEALIEECSYENRAELINLIDTIRIFKTSNETIAVRPEAIGKLFNTLDNIRVKKLVANHNDKKIIFSDT